MRCDPVRSTLILILALSCILAPGAANARAGVKQDAVKQLEKDLKSRLKGFKSQFKAREAQLDAEIGVVKAKLKSGAGSLNDVTAVFDALADFQSDVQALVYGLSIPVAQDVSAAMTLMDLAGIDYVDYPTQFRYGAPGPLTGFDDDIAAYLRKRYASLAKSHASLAKAFASKANTNLVVRMDPPAAVRNAVLTLAGDGSFSSAVEVTVDLAVGYSLASQQDDGRILAAGAGHTSKTVQITRFTGSGFISTDVTTTASNRWSYTDTALSEQNYMLRALSTDSVHGAHMAIGVP